MGKQKMYMIHIVSGRSHTQNLGNAVPINGTVFPKFNGSVTIEWLPSQARRLRFCLEKVIASNIDHEKKIAPQAQIFLVLKPEKVLKITLITVYPQF